MWTDNNNDNNFSFFVVSHLILTFAFIYLMIVSLAYIQHPYLGYIASISDIVLLRICIYLVIQHMIFSTAIRVLLFYTLAVMNGILTGFCTHYYYTHGAGIIIYLSAISTILLFGLIFWLIISNRIQLPVTLGALPITVCFLLCFLVSHFFVNTINAITLNKYVYLYIFTYTLGVLSFSTGFAQTIQAQLFDTCNDKDISLVRAISIVTSIWVSWVCFWQIIHLLFYMLTSNSTQTTSLLYTSPLPYVHFHS